jgi:hypothetical protein
MKPEIFWEFSWCRTYTDDLRNGKHEWNEVIADFENSRYKKNLP